MDIRTWLSGADKPERERVAREAGTSVAYFFQLAGGHRNASIELAKRIERATGGLVSRRDLRPDFFDDNSTKAA